jgi:hypothetical protein
METCVLLHQRKEANLALSLFLFAKISLYYCQDLERVYRLRQSEACIRLVVRYASRLLE